jgi:chitodextrinase
MKQVRWAGFAATVVTLVATMVALPPAAAVGAVVADGSSSAQAAPSCWAIKQSLPSSPNGIYWLQTPQLVTPRQFYCDMTTDGGGWVLIGRGREGWTWSPAGQGGIAALRTTITGPAAFSPATYPTATVQGLLGGGRVDALTDGIRVRRAANSTGTTWQEMRLKMSNRSSWSWAFGGGELMSNVIINGTTYPGGNSQSWAANGDQNLLRMTTNDAAAHNYKQGFAYGNRISGANDPNNYLWTYTTEKSALPFSQVFIRPKLTSATYPTIPTAGLPASTLRPLMSSQTSDTTPWGVTGIVGGYKGELTLEVESFAQIGNVMYVGGTFEWVQKGANPSPSEKIHQSYVAGFDVNTGEWLSTFRPVVNGEVWDLQATPQGTLIIGGEFTNVNGEPGTTGLAALDPVTGAVVPGWRASVDYVNTTGLTPQVRALDYQDGYIYVVGRINRITGGVPSVGPVTIGRAARLRVSDGRPDGTWKPNFDGTPAEVDASDRGDRVYFAGYFDEVNHISSPRVGVVSTAAGAANVPGLQPWLPPTGTTKTYQQTIKEVGDYVWVGGSEHIMSQYRRADFSFVSTNMTKAGGDFQALGAVDGVVYGSCHCGNWNYSGTRNYSDPIPSATDVNTISFIGAWDATTGEYLPDFYPAALDTRGGIGPWELTGDSNSCLWFGGDMTKGSWTGTAYQWLGGFGKFCPRDTTAPTVPTNLKAVPTDTGIKVTWSGSTDASGSPTYELLRNDRVIATTSATTLNYTDVTASLPATYFVRAIDDEGNRSATTAGAAVLTPDTTNPTVSLTSPSDGAVLYGDTTVTATASDDRDVASVGLEVDGQLVATDDTAPYAFSWSATAVGAHTLRAVATDTSGNTGSSGQISVTVPADTTAPGAPAALTVSNLMATQADLSWPAATDDRGVVGYRVLRDGVVLPGTVSGLTFTDVGLTGGTTYHWTVRAVDAAGNVSGDSPGADATTPAGAQLLFADAWSAADGTPWGSGWSTGTASGAVTTQGGEGELSFTDVTNAYSRAQLTGVPATADSEVLFSYRWKQLTANAAFSVYLRGSGGWQNGYRPRNGYGLQLSPTSGTVTVQKNVNGVTTNIRNVSGGQSVTTDKQWLRLRVVGSTISFRIWRDGQAEPSTWSAVETDSSVPGAGQLHLSLVRGGTNVGAKAVGIDDLSLRAAS